MSPWKGILNHKGEEMGKGRRMNDNGLKKYLFRVAQIKKLNFKEAKNRNNLH